MASTGHARPCARCSRRCVLAWTRTAMRHRSHKCVSWLAHARESTGRYRPTLSVGRDGIFVPLLHKVWQEGATATVSVLDRRGKRVGTVYLGHMPEPGQETLTAQGNALLHDMLHQVDSQGLRLVYVTDEGYHPSDYYQSVLQKMPDPRRPWRPLEWIRIIDYYHACQYVQQLADVIFGPGAESQHWAKRMREQLKTRANGVARVLQSASALRHKRGLWGQAKVSAQAYAYLHKRQSLDALSVLQASACAHRQWDHRGCLSKWCSPSGSSAQECRGRSRAGKSSWTSGSSG